MSKARDGKPDIVVFIVHRPSKCSDCGLEIHPGDFLHVHDEIALCLACADLDHLEFLERGDTAVTRRSRKYSAMSAVVVEWSKYGKRYERQGILVEPEALDRAVAESDADADVRAARAARSAVRRDLHDREYVDAFAKAIRAQYPGAPAGAEMTIAEHACRKYSGRVGRSAMAKDFDELAIFLAVRAHVRHQYTDYDAQLDLHDDRRGARASVRDRIESVLDAWRGES